MNVEITIGHEQDALETLKLIGPMTPAERSAVAAEVARLVQRHLRQRDDSHAHAYPDGGRRSHFWRKAAQAVNWSADAGDITVRVAHQGVRLRYAGEPQGIRPVNAGALAIPANAAAYGRLPSEFTDLRVVVFKGKGKAALVTKPKKGEHLGTVMFWLVKKTKPIQADPTVLPPPNVILGLAAARIRTMRARARPA